MNTSYNTLWILPTIDSFWEFSENSSIFYHFYFKIIIYCEYKINLMLLVFSFYTRGIIWAITMVFWWFYLGGLHRSSLPFSQKRVLWHATPLPPHVKSFCWHQSWCILNLLIFSAYRNFIFDTFWMKWDLMWKISHFGKEIWWGDNLKKKQFLEWQPCHSFVMVFCSSSPIYLISLLVDLAECT